MRSSGDQHQEFNTTLVPAVTVAVLLALGLLAVVYGCLESNQASGSKPHAEVHYLEFSA